MPDVAGGHRTFERLLDQAREGLPVPEPLPGRGIGLVLVLVDEGEEEPAVPEMRERPAHDAPDLARRGLARADGGRELLAQALDALEHDRNVQGVLAGKIPIQGAFAHAARLGHLVHLHLMVVVAGEDDLGRPQDVLAEPRGGRAAPTWVLQLGLRDGRRHLIYGPVRSHFLVDA